MDPSERLTTPHNTFAGAIGNALEWYDFAVYGFLAPILGRLFFPAEDAVASLLSAFAAFAVGYAARPIGGVIFGHLGDRVGRKAALIVSIVVMGAATFAIGVLLDLDQIGTAAAVLLVAPAYYFMAAAVLQLVALIGMTDMAGKPLPQAD